MAEELSKSAKKRLAKKARDEKAAEEQAPAAAPPAPKAAAAKAKPAAAQAAAPAAAAPKTAAAPAAAKAKAKPANPVCVCGKVFDDTSLFCNNCGRKRPDSSAPATATKATPAKQAAPVAEAPKAAAKSESKKAKKSPVAAPAPAPENIMTFSFEDDGQGGWENQAAKKKDKQKERQDTKKEEAKAAMVEEAKGAAPKAKSEATKASLKGKGAAKEKEQPQASTSGTSAAQKMIAALEADAAAKARAQIAQKALENASKGKGKGKDGAEGEVEPPNPNWVTAQVTVPSEKMGRIIGPQGKTLKMIEAKTGVGRIDTNGDVCTIVGDPEPVKLCEVAIREMVEKGFMTCAYDNYAEDTVMVHPEHFANLIGQRGAIIRKIKEDVHVEIDIPSNATKDAQGKWGKKKYPVQLAGSAPDVATAKEVINDIVKFKHHKITHPDKEHAEMEVPDWAHRYIIGPKGSEMRHIQNSFKVDVNIPRESNLDTGACENVLIVGPADGVEKAKAHIEKLIHNAETAAAKKPREDAAADDDRNKGDDEVDPEAAKYLLKKK